MSIFDLDSYTLDAIINLLDIRSLYNFSRTCQKFKNICHEIDDKRTWQKQVYGIFAMTAFDSVHDSQFKNRLLDCNLILIEACVNVIQYTYQVQENITARFADNTKHSNEVIELMLALSEVLLDLNYEKNSLLFVEGADNDPIEDEYDSEDEKESGFNCVKVDPLQLHYLYDSEESEIKKRRKNSIIYYKIFKEFDIKLFLKDKEFQDLCCRIRTMTKLDKVPDEVIAIAFQTLFGPTTNKLAYRKKEFVRTMTIEELHLLNNRVFTLRNNNLKQILARTNVSKLIQYCTSFYHFVSKEIFKDFMNDLVGFVKIFKCMFMEVYQTFAFLENKEIATFLMQSTYVEGGERLIFLDKEDGYPKYRYNLVGGDTSVDIVYRRDDGGEIYCWVNGIDLEDLGYQGGFEDPDENHDDIKQLLGFFNDFIDQNYRRKEGETAISARYVVSFLNLLYKVTQPITYSYENFYHLTVVKERTKQKRVENTLVLPRQKLARKAKK